MIEPFHPDRMASRILGMGDMLSFIEKAQQTYDEKQAAKLEEKLRKNRLTLTDYLDQMQQLKNMGDLSQIAGMLPGQRESPDPERQPQKAHRRRLRAAGGGCEPPAQAVRDDAAAHQADDPGPSARNGRHGRPDARLRPEKAAEMKLDISAWHL